MNNMYDTLDLHGEYSGSAKMLTEEFINDSIFLHRKKVCIIHGISGGVVKSVVYDVLKHDKRVKSFKIDFFNPGCTIVELEENI